MLTRVPKDIRRLSSAARMASCACRHCLHSRAPSRHLSSMRRLHVARHTWQHVKPPGPRASLHYRYLVRTRSVRLMDLSVLLKAVMHVRLDSWL